ncbi:MAG TPA: AIPR family protein [Bryobacteraceae bacterium]|nr:AIPR family protein [Bryobacteraceae bacterium]
MRLNEAELLRKMLQTYRNERAPDWREPDYFNWFVAEQVLKAYDPSSDEIKSGLVDGPDDGGIDGLYVLLEGGFISEDPDFQESRKYLPRGATIEVIIFQAKLTDSFAEKALDVMHNSLRNLLNFDRPLDDFRALYNERVLEAAKRLRETAEQLSALLPQFRLHIYYATLGSAPNQKVRARAQDLENELARIFPLQSEKPGSVKLLGGKELVELARMSRPSQYELQCTDILAPEDGGVVALARLQDFYRFITDENGQFRQSLFESNVRDYQGSTLVNLEIRRALSGRWEEDFWWLNNGVTVIADEVSSTGKKLTVKDPQIVNGLQTSREIFEYFRNGVEEDGRKILVRIVTPRRPESRDRIIKATNSQTTLPVASLRASDEIQWQIEQSLKASGWFYERRKNFYRNAGKPLDRIVSISELGQAVMAVVLQEPGTARARPSSLLKKDEDYRKVFSPDFSFEVYRAAIELVRLAEGRLKAHKDLTPEDVVNTKFYVAMCVAALACCERAPRPERIAELAGKGIEDDVVKRAIALVMGPYKKLGRSSKVAKGRELGEKVKERLSEELG